MTNIRNLAFAGNGATTLAFAGALAELENESGFVFHNLQRAIGDSTGALVAFMVCARFNIAEITLHLKKISTQLGNAKNPINFTSDMLASSYNDQLLRAAIQELLAAKGCTEKTTFGHLKERGFLDLYITTTKIFKKDGLVCRKAQTFSHEEDYNTEIFPILLASASTPMHFLPIKLKCISTENPVEDKEHPSKNRYVEDSNGFTYINGGHSNNFPEMYFDQLKYVSESPKSNESKKILNLETLGFRLCSIDEAVALETKSEEAKEESISTTDFLAYYAEVANSAVSSNLVNDFMENDEANRTIFIEVKNIKSSERGITKQDEDTICQAGAESYRRLRQTIINLDAKFTPPSTQMSRRVGSFLPSQYIANSMFRQQTKTTVETQTTIPEKTKGSCCVIS